MSGEPLDGFPWITLGVNSHAIKKLPLQKRENVPIDLQIYETYIYKACFLEKKKQNFKKISDRKFSPFFDCKWLLK